MPNYRNQRGYARNKNRSRSNKRQGAYIDPARLVRAATPRDEVAYTPVNAFADFDVNSLIKDNLASKGFVNPSPIQDQTIPLALDSRDVIGLAATGTGKTAAFAIPLINKLMQDDTSKALIVAPTRELAQQIEQEAKSIGRGSGLYGALLIGGSNYSPQLRDLKRDPQIVIGTPGRIKDHIDRGTLDLSGFNIVVLDEVDRMLDMGFVDDMREILSQASEQRQSLFFSATMDKRVEGIINTFAPSAEIIALQTNNASDNVNQDVIRARGHSDKLDKLGMILEVEGVKAIIFDETQMRVERLADTLQEQGFNADAIHGGKSQGQRQRALSDFKRGRINVLVATDVAARGIDVSDITHVINFSVPKSYEDYVHRVGRAGRAGKIGYAFTFVD